MKAPAPYGPVQQDLSLVESALAAVKQVDFPPLAEMLSRVISKEGQRLRPALALLAGQFGNYDLDKLVPLATSVELLHTATLVHDDVIDTASARRGQPTANSLFHNSVSVMLGDYMFAHAADMVCRTGSIRVIRLFSHTLMAMATGEVAQDMSAHDTSLAIRSYLQRIGDKTASLFATAAEGGAIIAGVPEEQVQALSTYGYNLGMAFQIVDDILSFTDDEPELGRPAGSDLMQGTLTLPALLLMESYPQDNPVQKLFLRQRRDDAQVRRLVTKAIDVACNSDIIEHSYSIARQFSTEAQDALTSLPNIPAHDALRDLLDYLMERRR